jgi:hypothetical protein
MGDDPIAQVNIAQVNKDRLRLTSSFGPRGLTPLCRQGQGDRPWGRLRPGRIDQQSESPSAPSRTGRRCHGAFRCRDGEVLAESGRFRIIVLLILDDHGAAAQHLLLLVGAQCFRPSGNPRRSEADIVGVDRAEGADAIDVLRREAPARTGAGISVFRGRGTGDEDGEAAGGNRAEDHVLHLLGQSPSGVRLPLRGGPPALIKYELANLADVGSAGSRASTAIR